MSYVRPTKPADIADVVGDGLDLFQASIRSIYLPALLLALIAVAIDPFQAPFRAELEPTYLEAIKKHWFRALVPFLIYFYLYAIIVAHAHYIASGAPRGVRSPLAIATLRFPTVLAVDLLSIVAVAVGAMLLIVPGIFLLVALYFSPMLPITEARGPIQSLREGLLLVGRFWWRVFAIIVIGLVTALVISVPQGFLARLCADWFESALVATTVSTLIHAAFEAIIHPLLLCFTYAMYQDIRLRREATGAVD